MKKDQDANWILTVNCKPSEHPWVEGTLEKIEPDQSHTENSYRFQAKVYDEGSKFGIDNGCISKLAVWKNRPGHINFSRDVIANYDRGWDIQPTDAAEKEVLRTIISGLEETPKQ